MMTEDIESISKRLVVGRKRDGRSICDRQARSELVRASRQPGVSLARIARICGINANVLSNWVRQDERGGRRQRCCSGRHHRPAGCTGLPGRSGDTRTGTGCGGHSFAASQSRWRRRAIDPIPPVGLLQSCPTLGPASFGFGVHEPADRDHQDRANERPVVRCAQARRSKLNCC